MSTWGQRDSWAAQKARAKVLDRDNRICQLNLPGCLITATQAHHTDSIASRGVAREAAADPSLMIAVCKPCHDIVTEQQRLTAWRQHEAHRQARKQLPRKPHPGE